MIKAWLMGTDKNIIYVTKKGPEGSFLLSCKKKDEQYGEGTAEFFAEAIETFYND